MHVLVTAGPTREHIDDVRFLSNASTGAMGIAVATVAAQRGHEVTLVLGPTHLDPPGGVRTVRVVSAVEMHRAVQRYYADADAVVMTAAVCDYRPDRRVDGKIKKTGQALTLNLVPNPDILADLGARKGSRVLVGFALEAEGPDAPANARAKLHSKNLDLIVLDSPAAMGAERARFVILAADGAEEQLDDASKLDLALKIVDRIEQRGTS